MLYIGGSWVGLGVVFVVKDGAVVEVCGWVVIVWWRVDFLCGDRNSVCSKVRHLKIV